MCSATFRKEHTAVLLTGSRTLRWGLMGVCGWWEVGCRGVTLLMHRPMVHVCLNGGGVCKAVRLADSA